MMSRCNQGLLVCLDIATFLRCRRKRNCELNCTPTCKHPLSLLAAWTVEDKHQAIILPSFHLEGQLYGFLDRKLGKVEPPTGWSVKRDGANNLELLQSLK